MKDKTGLPLLQFTYVSERERRVSVEEHIILAAFYMRSLLLAVDQKISNNSDPLKIELRGCIL